MASTNPKRRLRPGRALLVLGPLAFLAALGVALLRPAPVAAQVFRAARPAAPEAFPTPPELRGVDLLHQDADLAARKSAGCIQCHREAHDPHGKASLRIGCVDCHGGDPAAGDIRRAHVAPRLPEAWGSSANPVRAYTLLNHESPEFVRFVNPGDLRVAHLSCGTTGCHTSEVAQVRKSMMTHGAMLWEAALYNNGAFPLKNARFGESYSMHGVPQRVQTVPPPNEWERETKGVLPFLDPLPRYEITQPGNVLRVFERGRFAIQEPGLPNPLAEPGRPATGLSPRGLGTKTRTDPVMLGLQKTRLFDPTLNFLGTNDHPGDYRSSGCTACHVLYANDRSPVHSGPYASAGNLGTTRNPDPTIPKGVPGHPIEHKFTSGIPSSQCIVCHVHPGTNVMNSYLGYMWWDEETHAELMYPKVQKYPDAEELTNVQMGNPDEAAAKGLWSDPNFLANVVSLNPRMKHTQFADFHGHGWVFKAVFKKDRHGNFLDHEGRAVGEVTPQKLMAAVSVPVAEKERYREPPKPAPARDGLPVHLLDIHLEKGMHCIDCHFVQDMHGNGRLQGEVRNAIEIQCIDCHGTADRRAELAGDDPAEQLPRLRTSGPAAYTSHQDGKGRRLAALRTPGKRPRFEYRGKALYQNSMVEPDLSWEVVQTADTIDPASDHYNEKSRLAKTVRFEGGRIVWGDLPGGRGEDCAHADKAMSCIACHSAWNPSCFGCHLPQKANKKAPELHNNGDVTRNYVSYNFQTLRDDVFMLAKDGNVTGNRIGPARSSCAIHVGSYNANRESVYVQQQTISAEGPSGIAFSTNVPHTVRGGPTLIREPMPARLRPGSLHGKPASPVEANLPGRNETKQCTDCHVSAAEDNNAIMAQLLMQGTNYTNFIGKYCWVAGGEHGIFAVPVTERDEPQAVIGSSMHAVTFPDQFREHLGRKRDLRIGYEHPGKDVGENLSIRHRHPEILGLQARGEFLYAACGENGLRIFDIAFIDDKGFSERITTAPVSPLGQRLFVRSKFATAVVAPTTIAPDPTRTHRPENHEPTIHPLYAYLFVTDREEGLITVPVGTLLDGNPLNNYVDRETTFNPGGILCGARAIAIVGTYAYIGCDAGLVVVDLGDPKKPRVTSIVGGPALKKPCSIQVQFRYAFVCDEEGVKVLDVTDLAHPHPVAGLPLEHAHSIYVARTYAYVAAGPKGLVILDVEEPTRPRVDQVFNAGGCLNDAHDVKLGITYMSEFAYVADGKNGLRVLQLTSPETPGSQGFSPRPFPCLIATYKLPKGEALAVSEGVDRDRAVDESGNQISVFGRVGARPMNREEQRKLYLHEGQPYKLSDDPSAYPDLRQFLAPPPLAPAAAPE